MKHASNEKKHVPYLNGNPTRTVAISKQWHCQILVWALGLTMTTVKYDITLGTGEQADQDSCISNEKMQLILMGNLAGHEKTAIDSYYWRHYIETNIDLTCPYF